MSARRNKKLQSPISNFVFNLYMLCLCSFFLHIAARVPGLGIIRPDLLMVLMITMALVSKKEQLAGRLDNLSGKALSSLIVFLLVTLPLVQWPGSVIGSNLAPFVKALVFFYFTVLIVDTRDRLKIFIFIFIACQLFRILEPLYLHQVEGYWGERAYIGGGEFTQRLGGAPHDVINPNGLAFVIATVFPFLHYLWGSWGWKWKTMYYGLIPILLYVMVLTLSRSGFIALLIVGWNIFVKSRHKAVIVLMAAVLAGAAWTNMSDIQRDRYMSLNMSGESKSSGTAKARIDDWFNNFNVALARPVVGHGVGTSVEATYHRRGGGKIAHILYLEVAIEMGFIGFCFYMLFIKSIYQTLMETREIVRNEGDSEESMDDQYKSDLLYDHSLLTTLTACFWMYIVFSFAQYGVSEYHWYFLAGIIVVVNRNIKERLAGSTN